MEVHVPSIPEMDKVQMVTNEVKLCLPDTQITTLGDMGESRPTQ